MWVCMYAYVSSSPTHAHIHTHTYTYIHIHTHTHTHRLAVLELLVRKNVEMNTSDQNGDTPLHIAAKCGYERAVKQLLLAHVKIDTENFQGQTAADVAASPSIRHMLESYSELL
jgi:ankyrin repeat protein